MTDNYKENELKKVQGGTDTEQPPIAPALTHIQLCPCGGAVSTSIKEDSTGYYKTCVVCHKKIYIQYK